jgi:tRNA(Ile)-lysidine synthase
MPGAAAGGASAGGATPRSLDADLDRALRRLLDRCTFPPAGTTVTCGVSGGADSAALLVLAVRAGCDVTAVHVDHGLRPGSATEAEHVAGVAARLGARFEARTAPIAPGPNLEARARDARHRALGPHALLGHTADDQAETVLLAMLRGAGLAGLAGMGPAQHPILGLRRADTVALCAALDLAVVDDPSNRSPAHRRNRVRHELLPLLDQIAERDVAALLARRAELLRDDAALLDALAESLDPTDARALTRAPLPLARRAVRRWLAPSLGGYPPDAAAVERVLAVARGKSVACEVAGTTPGGVRVARTRGRLRVTPAVPSSMLEKKLGNEPVSPKEGSAAEVVSPPNGTEAEGQVGTRHPAPQLLVGDQGQAGDL